MSSPVYSHSFITIEGLTGAHSYAPESGYKAIVRDIDVYATGVLDIPFTYVFAHGSDGQAFFYYQWEPGAQAWEGWRGRQVIESGQSFDITSYNGPVDVSVSGYLLSLP